jgi:heme/copper-type cytochrome/quinol oxidase subunit 1
MTARLKTTLLNQPYFVFIIIASILLPISFFLKERTADIHVHDTLFVIPLMHILWIIIIALFLAWAIYRFTDKVLLTKYLTWFHVIATLVALIFFISACLGQNISPRQELSWKSLEKELQREQKIYLTISIVFVLAQIAFIINFVGGILRRRN